MQVCITNKQPFSLMIFSTGIHYGVTDCKVDRDEVYRVFPLKN